MPRKVTPAQFAAELLESALSAPVEAAKVVKKGAQNIKTKAQANVLQTAPTHQAHAHRAITYDEPTFTGFSVRTEIGYDKNLPGGSLGNLLEYGGKGDKSPAHRDIGRAADEEESRLEEYASQVVRKLL